LRILLWYSGEHPTLPRAEASAVFEAAGHSWHVVRDDPRFQCVETDAFGIDVEPLARRLGLTHDLSLHLFDGALEKEAIAKAADLCCFATGIRFAVRAERITTTGLRRTDVERRVGEALAHGRTVDLKRPDVVVRAFIDGDHVWVGQRIWDRDPQETKGRSVEHRPVFSPVSLPPKLARALVNVARAPNGGTVFDPLCGTGGVLLEAAAMGFKAIGSDLDPGMVEGSRKNLAHFGQRAEHLFVSDVGDAPANLKAAGLDLVDAVVSDMPYGRSASTGKEDLQTLYGRAFETMARLVKPGGRVVIGVPNQPAVDLAAQRLGLEGVFKVWVHRSLTRHFAVLRRPL
jgi:tRNA (guanine10-N2)-dimethyltransferase